MPEGDTVWRTARRLHQALAGDVLVAADLRWPSLATADLAGATTLEVVSRGKHVLHRMDTGLTLHSHLRMEGQWRVEESGRVRPAQLRDPRLRAVVGTTAWTCLGLRLGMLDLVRTEQEHRLVGHLGPDVLGPDWDLNAAVANMRRAPGRSVGEALLDQRNLAGIGTMYAAETLFARRQPPWQPVGEVGDEALRGLVELARRLLDLNRLNAVPTTTGSTRRGDEHFVHARSGLPCRRCGTTVRVAMIGTPPRERTMFYCPACQHGLGPTDDGRPQRPMGATQPGGQRAGRVYRNRIS
ncbi:MAG TPA: DNA-formamidopyrimidine glycosylase family protein [Dermatophilaceae bacterium]|nr:DNA-formamidopyrimidine glycosylase family protein [Dermatophilaceae bacterium]